MGTEFQIVLFGDDERALESAANYALDEVDRLDSQMSLYIPGSELCYINAHAVERPVPVEPGLFRLLERAAEIWYATDGAFDVTVGPLIDTWGFFRGKGAVPPGREIRKALRRVGIQHVRLDADGNTVHFGRPDVRVDLGGIAKGYAVGRVAEALRESGVESALVHGGHSTVCAVGAPPGEDGWPIGIRHPVRPDERMATIALNSQTLSTSGSYEKFFEHDGEIYSHIMDPRTGWPAQGMLSATAIAEAGLESDALSTAFFVMGIGETREYCNTRPGLAAMLVPEPAEGEEPTIVSIGTI